jgi:undecaprenyl-diphosphatase
MDTAFLIFFTRAASTEGFLIACALLLVIISIHCGKRRALVFLGGAAGVMLSVQFLKELLQVARPVNSLIEVTGYAFPSGHAAGAAFIALTVCYLVRHHSRSVRYGVYVASFLSAFLIGLSRISFMVHTPIQVAAGFVIGILWAYVFISTDRTEVKEYA